MSGSVRIRIVRGPRSGAAFPALVDRRLVVGRAPEASVRLDDAGISRLHFEVLWDGRACRLRDLGSTNGTLVNGRPAGDVELHDGDAIEVGETLFRVEIAGEPAAPPPAAAPPPEAVPAAAPAGPRPVEPRRPEPRPGRVPPPSAPAPSAPPPGDAPPTAPPPAGGQPEPAAPASAAVAPGAPAAPPIAILEEVAPMQAPPVQPTPDPGSLLHAVARRLLAEPAAHLYALLDAAQVDELPFLARQLGLPVYTLFTGSLAADAASVGPCLVALTDPLPFLEQWVERNGANAGVLLQAEEGLEAVHRHLRSIFVATDEEGQEYFFRFYDPRVLRAYLPACGEDDLALFFGPVRCWVADAEKEGSFVVYALGPDGLRRDTLHAGPAADPDGSP